MKAKKKALALLLSLIMIISLFSGMTLVSAAGEAVPGSEGCYYQLVDGLPVGQPILIVAEFEGKLYALTFDGTALGAAEITMHESGKLAYSTVGDSALWQLSGANMLESIGTPGIYFRGGSSLAADARGDRAIDSYDSDTQTFNAFKSSPWVLTFDGTKFATAQTGAAKILIFTILGAAKQVSAFQEGKEYAIVAKAGEKYYAFGATAANTFISKEMDVNADGDLIYSVDDDTVFWRFEGDTLKNAGLENAGDEKPYLYPGSGGLMTYGNGRGVYYKDGTFYWSTSAGTGYLTFDGTKFGFINNDDSAAAEIMLFERDAAVKEEEPDPIPKEYEQPDAIVKTAKKNADGSITLGFTSDVHYDGVNMNLKTWLEASGIEYIDTFGMCGDMGSAYASNANDFWTWAGAVMDYMTSLEDSGVVGDAVYTHGNHEWMASAGGDYSNSYYEYEAAKKLKQVGELVVTDDYIVYAFGAGEVAINNTYDYNTHDIDTLREYLKTAPTDRPIFILTHFPLHRWESRTVRRAQMVVDALNSNPDLNLIVLWGHNHSNFDEYYYQPQFPGAEIQIDTKGTKCKINFTYIAAGCTADVEYSSPSAGSASVMNKGLIATINKDGSISYEYYTIDGYQMHIKTPWLVRFRTGVDQYEVFNTQYVADGKTAEELTAPTMNGYEFVGWFTRKNGAEVEFDFSEPITNNTLVTAKYEKIVLPVTPAAKRDPNYVYVTIQDSQATAIGKSGTPIAMYPVPYTEGMTVGDAFIKVHELEYPEGTAGVETYDTTYGFWSFKKLWGHEPANGSLAFDYEEAKCYIDVQAEATPGHCYYALGYDESSTWISTSFMNSPSVEVEKGETVTMAAMTFAMDNSYNYAAEGMPGIVYCGTSFDDLAVVGETDDGYFELTFDEVGEYIAVVKGTKGDAVGFISVTNPVTYRLTDTLEADVEAILVVEYDGKFYAMNFPAEAGKYSAPVGLEVTVNGELVMDAPDSAIWTLSADNDLQNKGKENVFIYAGSSGLMTFTSGRSFLYDPETKHILMHHKYWLVFNGTSFTQSADEADATAFDIYGFSHLKSFTITFESGVEDVEGLTGTKLEGTPYEITEKLSREGYTFKGWNTASDGSGTAYAVGDTIEEDADLVLYAQWKKQSSGGGSSSGGGKENSGTFKITISDTEHGTVTANKKSADKGDKVKLTVKADKGWTLDTLKVVTSKGKEVELTAGDGDTWSFKMPGYNVTVTATFKQLNPYVDVDEDDYFFDAVMWAHYADPQVTNGMDETHFGPDTTATRAHIVTFLWRAKGCQEPKGTNNPFVDVKESDYFYKAVLWAVEQGIVKGTDETHFTPAQTCSTAHIVTMLYRALGAGTDGWYKEAGSWAKKLGLLEDTGLTVATDVDCPRAAIVTFLYRALAEK
ncbi:MAG: InlB B-repeat-containing protein [Oscillospiraceae bacterium]|nr:InlB B-repeat-containing protein [Oscillospiraceae bacterium]